VEIEDNFLSPRDLRETGRAGDRPASAAEPLPGLLRERLFPSRVSTRADVWIHAVSVGEVEVAVALSAELRALRPSISILVTSTTPAGMAHLRRRLGRGAATVGLRPCPVDLPRPVRRFLDATRPRLLILVETELWPVTLREAGRREIPVLVANARLSDRSLRRMILLRPLFARALAAVSRVAARTPADAGRFAALGIPAARISVTGDLKLDRLPPSRPPFAARTESLAAGRPVVVAGSVADEEIGLVLETRRHLADSGCNTFLLLAPRRPASFEIVAERLARAKVPFVRRSSDDTGADRADVFLLDTLGELAGAYHCGDAALLGGTWAPKGGHNVFEPLRAGIGVVHGPSVRNIREGLVPDATFEAADARSAAAALARLLSDDARRARARDAAAAFFEAGAGATRRAAETALGLLPEVP
jgi:3-deoxy-D-manno-octulosonic-acid transferase